MNKYKLLFFLMLFSTGSFAQNISGTWTGLLDAQVIKLHVVFHIDKDQDGKESCTMDSPDQSAKGIPAVLQYLSEDSLSVSVPAAGATYNGKRKEGIIRGTFTQMGKDFPLDLREEAITYRRPQHPVPPYPYRTEEVKFENTEAKATLAGTLTYPTNYQEGQPVPVVLMVTGSGPENRDEEIYEHKPFLVIADYLARNGIASLRYDDRKVGQSTGERMAFTTFEVADDAQKGVEYLRSLKKFSKVGVLGHSEGGSVVFILGARGLIDFGVSMAGIGVVGSDALYEQAKTIVETSGQTYPMQKEQFIKTVEAQHNPWLDAFMTYNPAADIQKTNCPIFALNGAKDLQVIASINLPGIEKNLPKNAMNKIQSYPGLNHLFQHCTTGMPTEYTGIEETISPEVLKDMAEWITLATQQK